MQSEQLGYPATSVVMLSPVQSITVLLILLPLCWCRQGPSGEAKVAQCSVQSGAVRIDGARENATCGSVEGRVQVCEEGEWRDLCDTDWTMEDAQVTCRSLNYSIRGALNAQTTQQSSSTSTYGISCSGAEESIAACAKVMESTDRTCGLAIAVLCFTTDEKAELECAGTTPLPPSASTSEIEPTSSTTTGSPSRTSDSTTTIISESESGTTTKASSLSSTEIGTTAEIMPSSTAKIGTTIEAIPSSSAPELIGGNHFTTTSDHSTTTSITTTSTWSSPDTTVNEGTAGATKTTIRTEQGTSRDPSGFFTPPTLYYFIGGLSAIFLASVLLIVVCFLTCCCCRGQNRWRNSISPTCNNRLDLECAGEPVKKRDLSSSTTTHVQLHSDDDNTSTYLQDILFYTPPPPKQYLYSHNSPEKPYFSHTNSNYAMAS